MCLKIPIVVVVYRLNIHLHRRRVTARDSVPSACALDVVSANAGGKREFIDPMCANV